MAIIFTYAKTELIWTRSIAQQICWKTVTSIKLNLTPNNQECSQAFCSFPCVERWSRVKSFFCHLPDNSQR